MVLVVLSLFAVGAVFWTGGYQEISILQVLRDGSGEICSQSDAHRIRRWDSRRNLQLHCAAIDLILKIDKAPKAIRVGDYSTKNLIDAEKAFWIIGGSKMGVMTKRAKWAFEKKGDAEKFMKENGGTLAVF